MHEAGPVTTKFCDVQVGDRLEISSQQPCKASRVRSVHANPSAVVILRACGTIAASGRMVLRKIERLGYAGHGDRCQDGHTSAEAAN